MLFFFPPKALKDSRFDFSENIIPFLTRISLSGWRRGLKHLLFFLRNAMFDTLFLCRHISTLKEALLFHRTFSTKLQMPTVCFLTSPRKGVAKTSITALHCFHLLPSYDSLLTFATQVGCFTPSSNYKKSIPPGGAGEHSFPHPFHPCAK